MSRIVRYLVTAKWRTYAFTKVFKLHAVLQAFGSRGRASYLISRSVGFYVFNGIGPNATSRHVRVPNSVGFVDDAVVRWTVCCGFA